MLKSLALIVSEIFQKDHFVTAAAEADIDDRIKREESPPIGGAARNATSLIPQRLSSIMIAITCSENVHA